MDRYGLERFARDSRRREFRRGLYYAALLERGLLEAVGAGSPARPRVALPDPLTAIDVGCADWYYAPALHGVLSRWGGGAPRSLRLTGVELDANRLSTELRSRGTYAAARAAALPGARFIPGDFLALRERADVITFHFPFVLPRALLLWGLPLRALRPRDLAAHAWEHLSRGGVLFIANQGPAEHAEQLRVLSELRIRPVWSGRVDSPLWRPAEPTFVTVAVR